MVRSAVKRASGAIGTAPASKKERTDLLEWDVWLEEPPAKPERIVLARFECEGRDKPMPIGLLEDE